MVINLEKLILRIAEELNIRPGQVEGTVKLLMKAILFLLLPVIEKR